jgi:type II secretory pathway pseudopilin PulG
MKGGVRRRVGFTLVEVVTAIVIVAALIAVTVPVFMQRSRAARADAIVAELESLRTSLFLFYNDVGRIPLRLDYLYTIPGSPLDVCTNAIPTLNVSRFRGPYVARPIYRLNPAGGVNSYLIATGDSVDTVLNPVTFNGVKVVQISVYGPEKDIVDLVDTKVDGAVDLNNGMISWASNNASPLLNEYTIKFNIPIRNQGC